MATIYTATHHPLTRRAASIAAQAHHGVSRTCGLPYITHPAAVAVWLAVHGYSHLHVAVGWLHDVVEDTDITLDDLANLGMPDVVVVGVDAMTRRPHEAHIDAVARAAENEIANPGKQADARHNSSPEQLVCFDPATRARKIEKYTMAQSVLRAAA